MITKQEFINAYALNLRCICNEQAALYETETSMRDFAKALVGNICNDSADPDGYVTGIKTAAQLGHPNLSVSQLGQLLRSLK